MSRKWERMVEKNRKQINRVRKKTGKNEISTLAQPEMQTYRGRSILLSLLFLSVSVSFLTLFRQYNEQNTLYWVTISCYALLALYFFFIRRPYLKIGKSEIATRKMGRDRFVKATEIEKIVLQRGFVMISIKGKKNQWVFSKMFNLFDVQKISEELRQFALKHQIPIHDESEQGS